MGKIILLNTPIGNLGDLTPRVLEALKEGEHFAVEDTRVFMDLLGHLGIAITGKRIFSLHDQSEDSQVSRCLEVARKAVLYVASEAGSPIVSDPAYPLMKAAYEEGIEIDSYSGVSSPIMALELSGLPPIPFHFVGFLPREKGKINKIFSELQYGTTIFFEAPTRIEDTLDELAQARPELMVAVVRELSKKFQQVMRFKAKDWINEKKAMTFKGEFVFLVHQSESSSTSGGELKSMAREMLASGASPKLMAKLLSLILDRPTKEIYSELIRQNRE